MRIVYSVMLALMMPLIVTRLFWRSFKQRGYRKNIDERFGFYHQPALNGCIWIHAVSVGETRAAEPLIRRLNVRYPARPILLTCMTPTGRDAANDLFGPTQVAVYLPYDFVSLHQRLLDHFRPSILLVMETEIWPNLFYACQQNAVPALIINARLSEKSLHRYCRFAMVRTLAQQSLQSVRVVAAQSSADAARFAALGARKPVVTGNLKFDVLRQPQLAQRGQHWRAMQPTRRVLLCASTRNGEEELLLSAYLRVFDAAARRATLLVIVPRHQQRFDQVAGEIRAAGLSFARRSQPVPETPDQWTAEVLLGDSMGEMTAYYSFCDVAIIGGSFLPFGGQNLIEACALGKPVIMGPSTFNFTEVAQLAREAGAMQPVADALAAMQAGQTILQNGTQQRLMANAGSALVEANRGATDKTMAIIASAFGAN